MATSTRDRTAFVPTDVGVAEYRRVRDASRDLHSKIVETLPTEALAEVGEVLGLRNPDGGLVFPFEEAADVLMDACLYGWYRNGRNLVQEFARSQAVTGEPRLSTLEARVLEAASKAHHHAFRVVEVVPEAGVRAVDGRTGEAFFLMDIALSGQPGAVGAWLTSRIAAHGEWSMTTGAALCLGAIPDAVLRGELRKLDAEFAGLPADEAEQQAALTLTVLGLRLRAGAEEDPWDEVRAEPSPVLPPRHPGRNEPCPCESGKKYKRCCGP